MNFSVRYGIDMTGRYDISIYTDIVTSLVNVPAHSELICLVNYGYILFYFLRKEKENLKKKNHFNFIAKS